MFNFDPKTNIQKYPICGSWYNFFNANVSVFDYLDKKSIFLTKKKNRVASNKVHLVITKNKHLYSKYFTFFFWFGLMLVLVKPMHLCSGTNSSMFLQSLITYKEKLYSCWRLAIAPPNIQYWGKKYKIRLKTVWNLSKGPSDNLHSYQFAFSFKTTRRC